jgi:hypothetical protein
MTWMTARFLILSGLLVTLGACSGGFGDDDDSAPARCAQEWVVPSASGVVVVDLDALAGGVGTRAEPVQTIQEGLDLVRAEGARYLLIAPGTYVGTINLGPDDTDLAIVGCGEDTVVDAAGGVGIDVSGASGVVLRDLVIENANPGIRIGAGAGSAEPVQVISVLVRDATRLGVSVTGTGTRVVLSDVRIEGVGVDPVGDALGYGLLAWGVDELTVQDSLIRDATRAGMCISDVPQFTIRRTTVEGTVPFLGALGRGVQIQDGSTGDLEALTVTGSSDAGIFVLAPAGVVIRDSAVSGTLEADVPGEAGSRAGAGLAATSGVLEEPAPAAMLLEVRDSSFNANARIGVLLEGFGLEATLSGLVLESNIIPDESTFPVDAPVFQSGATVTVLDGTPAAELLGDEVQIVFRGLLPVN